MTRFTVFAYILCSILCSTCYAQESEVAKESFAIGDKILMNDKPLNATFGESITLDAITQENGLVVIFPVTSVHLLWHGRIDIKK